MHEDKQKDIAERETNIEMMETILGVISRQSLWTVVQSPVQSGESPVKSGERQLKVANRQLKVANGSSKWQIAS